MKLKFVLICCLIFTTPLHSFGVKDNEAVWSSKQKFKPSEGKQFRVDMEECLKQTNTDCLENLFRKSFNASQAGRSEGKHCQNFSESYENVKLCIQEAWVREILNECIKTNLSTMSVQVGEVLCSFSRDFDGKIKIHSIFNLP